MTLLDRYIGKRFLATMAKVMISMVLLVATIDFLSRTQDLMGRYQAPWSAVFKYYAALAPAVLLQFHAAALSVLVAGLLTLGKAAQDQEITAALAGGISFRRIARTPLVLAALTALAALVLGETVGVSAARASREIKEEYFSRFSQKDNQGIGWTNLGKQWTCHALKFNRVALTGEDVFLHAISETEIQEIRAKRIFWHSEKKQWFLEDGIRYRVRTDGEPWTQSGRRITQVVAPFSESPAELFALDTPADTKNAHELRRDILRAQALGVPVAGHWVDYHVKFARPALCFLMALIAAPFAMRLRRGGVAVGFGAGIVIALAYLMLFFASVGLGHLGKLSPFTAAWLANAVFLVIGLHLFWRTPT